MDSYELQIAASNLTRMRRQAPTVGDELDLSRPPKLSSLKDKRTPGDSITPSLASRGAEESELCPIKDNLLPHLVAVAP